MPSILCTSMSTSIEHTIATGQVIYLLGSGCCDANVLLAVQLQGCIKL